MALGLGAFHEVYLQPVEDVLLLLAHGLAELVRLALGEACEGLGEAHHLLLVDRDAVGFLKQILHLGKVVMDLGRVVLARHEVRDVVHGTRAVEGVHCDEVLEALGMKLHQPFAHAAGFELEHGLGVAAGIEVEGGRVVDGDGLDVDFGPSSLAYQLQRAGYDAEGLEAEEVHLQHSYVLDLRALVLTHPDLLAGSLVFAHGNGDVVGEVAAADDHGAGVDAYLADATLQALGVFQHFAYEGLAFLVFFL